MTLPLTANYITEQLNCFPNFIGCIPENELDHLVIGTLYPCYLIVNIDSGTMPGSHWIAIGIFSKSIEVFDSLGFDIFNWPRVPCSLLKFVHRLSVTRELKVSKRLQSDHSNLCGYYCLFYIFMRKHTCMETLLSYFGSKLLHNDSILKKFFLYMRLITFYLRCKTMIRKIMRLITKLRKYTTRTKTTKSSCISFWKKIRTSFYGRTRSQSEEQYRSTKTMYHAQVGRESFFHSSPSK